MKHKFKRGDLVTMKYELTTYVIIELGVILSFSEINSMYAIIHVIAQFGPMSVLSNAGIVLPHMKNRIHGREQSFPISNLAIATTDTIDNYLVKHGIIKGKAHTFSV